MNSSKNEPFRQPYQLVESFAIAAPKGASLDIGAGEGHDTLYLAEHLGFSPADAVDNSSRTLIEASGHILNRLAEEARRRDLPIRVWRTDYQTFDMGDGRYALIVALNSLHLAGPAFPEMVMKISTALIPGGRLILSLITRTLALPEGTKIGKLSERQRENILRVLWDRRPDFRPDTVEELERMFPGFAVRHAADVPDFDDPHPGSARPHVHTILEFVADKPG